LQAALGYNLAQSLFAQRRNLVCEGLPDLWYVEGVSQLLKDAGRTSIDEGIAIVCLLGARARSCTSQRCCGPKT